MKDHRWRVWPPWGDADVAVETFLLDYIRDYS